MGHIVGINPPPPPALSRPGGWLTYLYLLRVPVLVLAVLCGLPFVAQYTSLKSLLGNLLLLSPGECFFVTLSAVIVAWSVLLTSRLVLLNGEERFGTIQGIGVDQLGTGPVFLATAAALPVVSIQFLNRIDFGLEGSALYWNVSAIAAGALAAYFLAFFALFIAVLYAARNTQGAAFSFPGPRVVKALLRFANRHSVFPANRLRDAGSWIMRTIPPDLRAGYIDPRRWISAAEAARNAGEPTPPNPDAPADNPGYGLPWSGHWLAFCFGTVAFGVYVTIYFVRTPRQGEPVSVPALAYVLLLLLNLNWILSFAAFFLDRFRIPLLLPLALFACFGTFFSSHSDNYYKICSNVSVARVSPKDVLETPLHRGKPVIVVVTAGGGIQAAAWTARVLTGLQHESLGWAKNAFADSLALVSSVSGGAVGSMFFLAQYGPPVNGGSGFRLADSGDNFAKLIEKVAEPSLDDIAWALVYRDIPRILPPYLDRGDRVLLDRGRVLELSWERRLGKSENLGNWRDGVKAGWLPAAIFNATIVETGEPLLFSTTDFERSTTGSAYHAWSFHDLYRSFDVPVATAVRLAASFPYVTPAARPLLPEGQFHVVDGGYYDNYGVASAVEWIDEALMAAKKTRAPVLVIQIRSFPNDPQPSPQPRGWFLQTYAPLKALLGVRTAAQLVRDRAELMLLRERWHEEKDVPLIRFAGFQFQGQNAPLSWKMNPAQTQEIDQKWKDIFQTNPDDIDQVRCVLDPSFNPERCKELARTKDPW